MMRKYLYTLFLDYRGGTYISQIKASSPLKALTSWADALDYTQVQGIGSKGKVKLKETIKERIVGPPTQVEGIKNTWCFSSVLHGHLVLIHITKTEE
jgi:hypothetical protein